jgi:RNase H-like domain found in reverse transcriptase
MLKQCFTASPILAHFDPQHPCHLTTDTSDFALTGVLQQPADDQFLHPVAIFSRKLAPAEINYDMHDKELLAIIECFQDMRAWLLGSPFLSLSHLIIKNWSIS